MCTFFGGLDDSTYSGYTGQWYTWELSPPDGASSAAAAAPMDPPSSVLTGATARLIDQSVNLRLWKWEDRAARVVRQANMYAAPSKMAGTSTRFGPYLSFSNMDGSQRPDGYGIRSWAFDPSSSLVSVDGSSWLTPGSTPERDMRVISVAGSGCAIINPGLPPSFSSDQQPGIWCLEFIFMEPGSLQRRWASMNWYDASGRLAVNRALCEDVVQGVVLERQVEAGAQPFTERRDSPLGPIDAYAAAHAAPVGTATVFAYDTNLQLTVSSAPCTWGLRSGGPAPLVEQCYPDWAYSRVPAELRSLVEGEAAAEAVRFEAGAVLRDGSLSRWVLEYETSGRRLLRSATYELYPPKST